MTDAGKLNTEILNAVNESDQSTLEHLVDVQEIPVTGTTSGQQTAAHIAAEKGNLDIFNIWSIKTLR